MFKEYSEYFKMHRTDKSAHTIRSYEKILGDFVNYFNIESVENIDALTSSQYREYQTELKTRISSESVNAHFRVIKAFVHWLHENEYIESESIDRVKSLKGTFKEQVVLTEEEAKNLIYNTKNIQTRFMILFMLTTGVREEELVNIKITDIQNCHVLIHGKGNKERSIQLTDDLCQVMSAMNSVRFTDSEYLFYAKKKGGKISTVSVYNRIKKACLDVGLSPERIKKITPHKFRGTFLTEIAEQFDVAVAQKLAGHARITTTMRYVKVSQKKADYAASNQKSYLDRN